MQPRSLARMMADPLNRKLLSPADRRAWDRRWSSQSVAALSTEAIEARLQEIGVPYTRTEFIRLTHEYRSGWDLSKVWRNGSPKPDAREDDFLAFAACELWKRLCPERPSLEMIDDWMQDGYGLVAKNKHEQAMELWMRAWVTLRPRFTPDLRKVSEADRRVCPGMSQSLFNWVRDVSMEARNGSLDSRACAEFGIRFIGELLESFPDEDTELHFRADAAAMHFCCGRDEEGERLFLKLIEQHPNRAAGYVGLSDALSDRATQPRQPADLARAVALLEQALAYPVADAKDYDIENRLKECRAAVGRR